MPEVTSARLGLWMRPMTSLTEVGGPGTAIGGTVDWGPAEAQAPAALVLRGRDFSGLSRLAGHRSFEKIARSERARVSLRSGGIVLRSGVTHRSSRMPSSTEMLARVARAFCSGDPVCAWENAFELLGSL